MENLKTFIANFIFCYDFPVRQQGKFLIEGKWIF